jgi:hypothetical protein
MAAVRVAQAVDHTAKRRCRGANGAAGDGEGGRWSGDAQGRKIRLGEERAASGGKDKRQNADEDHGSNGASTGRQTGASASRRPRSDGVDEEGRERQNHYRDRGKLDGVKEQKHHLQQGDGGRPG